MLFFFLKLRQKNDSDHVSNLLFYFIFYILQFFSFINNFILKIFHAMASKKKKNILCDRPIGNPSGTQKPF